MSNLVDHARRELEAIGEEPETIDGIVAIVQAFVDMGHSGGSASIVIPMINDLLQFKNLSPLTDDPDEWTKVTDDLWQSTRRADAFSEDVGKTYYVLEELRDDKGNSKYRHQSKSRNPNV